MNGKTVQEYEEKNHERLIEEFLKLQEQKDDYGFLFENLEYQDFVMEDMSQ